LPWVFYILSNSRISENGRASAGCIHLEEGNAEKVYDWISERTRITIDYPW
jgi:lipoprotein-anchoring transpeptidase ErfK/SrfK